MSSVYLHCCISNLILKDRCYDCVMRFIYVKKVQKNDESALCREAPATA